MKHQDDYNFATETILGVTFALLLKQPNISTNIPAAQWGVSNHHLYPDSFQQATKTILLCQDSNFSQPIERKPTDGQNFAASLPKEVWLYILSFTTRKCMFMKHFVTFYFQIILCCLFVCLF